MEAETFGDVLSTGDADGDSVTPGCAAEGETDVLVVGLGEPDAFELAELVGAMVGDGEADPEGVGDSTVTGVGGVFADVDGVGEVTVTGVGVGRNLMGVGVPPTSGVRERLDVGVAGRLGVAVMVGEPRACNETAGPGIDQLRKGSGVAGCSSADTGFSAVGAGITPSPPGPATECVAGAAQEPVEPDVDPVLAGGCDCT